MKLLTIIGTRPQYIKLKPFYDYCKENSIENIIVDTCQHYSYEVSSLLIRWILWKKGYNSMKNYQGWD